MQFEKDEAKSRPGARTKGKKTGQEYLGGVAACGVRRQNEAATALWMRDLLSSALQSVVALRLPPHSKICGLVTSCSVSEGLIRLLKLFLCPAGIDS